MAKSRIDALFDIGAEFRAERGSSTAARRTVRALKTLGFNQEEIVLVMSNLDYCRQDGSVYVTDPTKRGYVERCW